MQENPYKLRWLLARVMSYLYTIALCAGCALDTQDRINEGNKQEDVS